MKSEMYLPVTQGEADFISDLAPPTPVNPREILRAAEERQAAPKSALEVADRIVQIMQNPEEMQGVLDDVADPYDDHAPQVASDLRLATANALTFLASKAPRKMQFAPGMAPIEPTAADVRKFERYLKAVNDPAGLLDDALRGDITGEAVEAVRTVYPQIFSTIQSQIAERLTNSPNIPYQRRMQLSTLLGQDMTGTRNPRMAMSAQAVYGSQQPQQQAQMPLTRAQALRLPERAAYEGPARRNAQPTGPAARALGAGAKF